MDRAGPRGASAGPRKIIFNQCAETYDIEGVVAVVDSGWRAAADTRRGRDFPSSMPSISRHPRASAGRAGRTAPAAAFDYTPPRISPATHQLRRRNTVPRSGEARSNCMQRESPSRSLRVAGAPRVRRSMPLDVAQLGALDHAALYGARSVCEPAASPAVTRVVEADRTARP